MSKKSIAMWVAGIFRRTDACAVDHGGKFQFPARSWLTAGITDMRCDFNGLAAKVETMLVEAPFSGHISAFRGRRDNIVKLPW